MSLLSSGMVTGGQGGSNENKVATLAAPGEDSGDQSGRRERKARTADSLDGPPLEIPGCGLAPSP